MKERLFIKLVFFSLLTLFVSSCASSVRFTTDARSKSIATKTENNEEKNNKKEISNDSFSEKLVSEAESWLGTPYVYGGDNRDGVDCSGFVLQVYYALGIQIPRTSVQQYEYVKKVDFDDKKTGDLIFFTKNNKINHVGIYLGSGKMIHASSSSGVIKQSINDSYFKGKIAGVGRIK